VERRALRCELMAAEQPVSGPVLSSISDTRAALPKRSSAVPGDGDRDVTGPPQNG